MICTTEEEVRVQRFVFFFLNTFNRFTSVTKWKAADRWRHIPEPCCSDGGWLRLVEVDPQAVRFSHSYEGSLQRHWLTLPWRYQGSPGVWCVCPNALPGGTWEQSNPAVRQVWHAQEVTVLWNHERKQRTYLVTPGVAPTLQARALFKLLIKLLFPTLGNPAIHFSR